MYLPFRTKTPSQSEIFSVIVDWSIFSMYSPFRTNTPSQSEIFSVIVDWSIFSYVFTFQDQNTLPKGNIFCYWHIRDIFNWRQLNFKGVINCITIDCHNTSKQLSYIKENLNLNFGQSENFILFSPVLFCPPSWIIVQSDDCFSIRHLEFLSNHRLSCHLELLSNQKAAFHLPSCIFDHSEMTSPPPPPPRPLGIELSLLHYFISSHILNHWLLKPFILSFNI